MAPRQGTGHINWSAYLDANRGGATALGQRLMQPITEQAQRAQAGLDSGTTAFNQDVAANTLAFDPNRPQSEWAGLGSRTYQGPGSLMDNQQFATRMNDAQQAARGAERLSSIYGREAALQQSAGKTAGAYSPGMSRFDSALLQGTSQGGFTEAKKSTGGLLDKFTQAQAGSLATAGRARDATSQAAGQYASAARANAAWNRPLQPRNTISWAQFAPRGGPAPRQQAARRVAEENSLLMQGRGGTGRP